LRVLEHGKTLIMRPDWRAALSPEAVREASELIVHGRR
jgi:hypothetical protein